ncbi:MAG: DUF6443 domain-containing protein [Bacteroidota bacterium]
MKTIQLKIYQLAVALLILPYVMSGQSNWSYVDSYDRSHVWNEIFIEPEYGGTPLASDGSIFIESGEVVFDECGDRADKRVYRKLGSPLDESWVMELEFTPTAGGPHGVGHIIAGLTAGTKNGYNEVPEVVGTPTPSFSHTNQDGIYIEYLSPLSSNSSTFYVRIRAKDGTTYLSPSGPAMIPTNGVTRYLRLERQTNGQVILRIFSDAARTNQTHQLSINVPSSIEGLNVLQHSTIPQGSYKRELSATVDNTRIYDSNLPCVRCSDYSLTPSSSENYVVSKKMQVAVQNPTAVENLSNSSEALVEIGYMDGLGRPLQEVSVDGGANCSGDFVQYHRYNGAGQETQIDLPYVATGANGSFRHNGAGGLPTAFQQGFYSSSNFPHIPTADLNKAYSVREFEASPLDRITETGAAGAAWQPGGGHTLRTSIQASTSAHNVFMFGVNPQINQYYTTDYAAGELIRTESRDEHNIRTWTFTDKLGRKIMQQKEVSGADARTYYIYNEKGQLIYVLQPRGVEKFEANSTSSGYGGAYQLTSALLTDYAFQFEYDGVGRVIRKRIPGADWVEFVYNQLDEIVLTQDGNQRLKSPKEWTFTKYDMLGRSIQTGIFSDVLNRDRSSLQSYVTAQTTLHERRDGSNFSSWHGYTNFAFPSSWIDLHTITYYDDYDFDRNGVADPAYDYVADATHFPTQVPSVHTRGMLTAVKVRVLEGDSDMRDWMMTVTHYNDKGYEIQTIAENHVEGRDVVWNEVDFVGKVLFSKREHIGHDGSGSYDPYERSATIYTSYTYDPFGRLIRTEQKTEDPENPGHETEFVSLAEQHYDPLGQLKKKNLHYEAGNQYLQLGDYEYNIRNWITRFNDPGGSNVGNYEDLFSFSLEYNSGNNAQYNGNISSMSWQTLGDGENTRHYFFSYDELNRLTAAQYEELDAQGGLMNQNRYSLENVSYDKSGNLLSLRRRGKNGSGFGVMDDLSYSYQGNQLTSVSDAGLSSYYLGIEQFEDGNTSGPDYLYDANGNMIEDKNKGIDEVVYNHFNKPTKVTKGLNYVSYIYAADGTKLRQKLVEFVFEVEPGGQVLRKITDYVGGIQYEDRDGAASGSTEMIFFSHAEGRVRRSNNELVYESFLKDHLGNNRIMFADENEDRWIDPNTEVLQEEHLYPFGMRMTSAGSVGIPSEPNQYVLTGKERQDELAIGWADFGARMYDPSIGRWNSVDPLAEKYLSKTSYNYVLGNPMLLVDPDGRQTRRIQDLNGNWHDITDDDVETVYDADAQPTMPDVPTREAETAGVNSAPVSPELESAPTPARPVSLEVSNVPTGVAFIRSYPENDGNIYIVPTYRATLSGTMDDGTPVSIDYDVVRVGVVKNTPTQVPYHQDVMTGNYNAPYSARWVPNAIGGHGGWKINNSPYYIHIGDGDPHDGNTMGNKGCVAICGRNVLGDNRFNEFQMVVQILAGTTTLSAISIDVTIQAVNPLPPVTIR